MSDGLTVPFALAAGLSGAVGSSGVVVVAGLAEIAAGAIAMGLGGYLAARSDAEHYTIERARELAETAAKPAAEAAEVTHILRSFGLTTEDTEPIVAALRFRHGAAEPLVLRGVLQEVDDLDELVLGVVDARDVVEGDLRPRVAVALGTAAAEPEEPPTAGHHALIHPDEPHDQEERGAEAEDQVLPEGPALVERPRIDDHALLLEQRLETGVGEGGQQRLEAQRGARVRPLARVGHLLLESALDRVALAGHLLDVARLHLLLEERVGDVEVARRGRERPHEYPVGCHDDEDGGPPGLRPKPALARVLGGFAGVPPLGALVTGPILAQRCRCRKLVAGPASSLPLERVDDPLARQRPGKLLLALPRGGAVDHWAGDVARGVAGRSVAGRRLLDLWREPDPALLRQHHLSLAGAPAARGGYSQAPRSCGDLRTDRGHLYADLPGDAAGRVGMERLWRRMGSGASRVAAQALLPTSAALVVDRALRGHGVDGGRRRRTAGAEPARRRTDMARDGRGALHPRRSDLRGEMAEPRATGLWLPRGIPHLRAGRQHHALRVHDALRSAWGVGAASSAHHSGSDHRGARWPKPRRVRDSSP